MARHCLVQISEFLSIKQVILLQKYFQRIFISFSQIVFQLFYVSEYKLYNEIIYSFISFFYVFFITVLLSRIKNTYCRKGFKLLLLTVLFAGAVIESFTLYNYHTLVSSGIVNVVLETNYRETAEFLKMYVGFREYGLAFAIAVLFFIIKKYFHVSEVFWYRQRYCLLCMVGVGFLLAARSIGIHQPITIFMMPRIYVSVNEAVQGIQEYKNLANKVNRKAELTQNNAKIKNVVLILGESTARNHMGSYGYYLKTTPYMDKNINKGQAFLFRDIISPHSHTSAVLAKFFTFSNYENKQNWYETTNLISILNTAGYHTIWLSNQESSGAWGSVAQVFSDLSAERKFTHYRDSEGDYAFYDEDILPLLDNVVKNSQSNKNFYVVHLMGTHGAYKNRYPIEYAQFSAQNIRSNFANKYKTVIAEYDNAVLYNDFIVNEIIQRFADKEAVIIYVSDHGEEVYDSREYVGHTEDNGSKYMIEIPMLVWVSEKFKETYPDKLKAIKSSVNRPYVTDDMIHSFLDIMEIKTADYEKTRSIFHDEFNSNRKRIYHNQDYDKELK